MARSRTLGYGEGSIYQQGDGRWRGELRLGTKRRRVSAWTRRRGSPQTRRARAQSEAGLPLGTNMRLGEWLDWYQAMIDGEKKPQHLCELRLGHQTAHALRGRRLRELDVLEFEALLKDLANPERGVAATKGRGGREKPLSKSSLNRIKMVLGAALHEAERRRPRRARISPAWPTCPPRRRAARRGARSPSRKPIGSSTPCGAPTTKPWCSWP